MNLYENIINKIEKIAVVGLGYVGMPLAVLFSEKVDVLGFDVNESKIEQYKLGHDITNEVGNDRLKNCKVHFTYDEKELENAKFIIVAVPTPINKDTTPDLRSVVGASEIVGRNLQKGSIIVYESTVYPGVTEEICIPILERESGLKCGQDFKIGYSPERINPGDRVHTLDKVIKIVSGMDEESLEQIAKVYELIITAGVYRAESIKVAEAAKIIENSQRDINIAFMNEVSIIFNKIGIDTKAVIDAASTKWNFMKFNPGLVGGHCIGVDPYYLIYRSKQLGYDSKVILSGRTVNDGMGKFIAENTIKSLIKVDKKIKDAKVAIMGITFKENCPDIRNSKVMDIIEELREYGIEPLVYDPIADRDEVKHEYNIELAELNEIRQMDVIIFAVAQSEFRSMSVADISKFYNRLDAGSNEAAVTLEDSNENKILIDVKGIFNKKEVSNYGYLYWRL